MDFFSIVASLSLNSLHLHNLLRDLYCNFSFKFGAASSFSQTNLVQDSEGQGRKIREGGDIGLFITLVPKVFLLVGLTTLGTIIELFHKVECLNVLTNNCKLQKG